MLDWRFGALLVKYNLIKSREGGLKLFTRWKELFVHSVGTQRSTLAALWVAIISVGPTLALSVFAASLAGTDHELLEGM